LKSFIDGVVKVSIYCVIAVDQKFDILHVCLHSWSTTMPCTWRFILSHPEL